MALILTSPNGDGTAILRGHPSHAKVQPPAGQRKYLHFLVIFKTLSIGPAPGIEPATSRLTLSKMKYARPCWSTSKKLNELNDFAPFCLIIPGILDKGASNTFFFFYKNMFYKNIKAEIRKILRINPRLRY